MVNWWGPIAHKQGIYLLKAVVSPSLSSEGILFPVRKSSGISEDNDDRFSLVGSSRNPLVPHLGVNFVFPWLLVPLY